MQGGLQNTNALKWTTDVVDEFLDKIYEELLKEDTPPFLSCALLKLQLSRRAWDYWKKKFNEDEHLSEKMAIIETLCEGKLVGGALQRKLHATVSILALRYAHRWHLREQAEEKPYDPNEGVWIVLDEERRYKIG
jgi:hypothetical protein